MRIEIRGDRAIAAALAGLALLLYLILITGHQTGFDYFGRLAHAMTQGRLWLDGAPLSELDPGRDGHLYNVQPPLPAILMVPLVPFGPPAKIETFLCAVLGAASAFPLFMALRALT
ncbi:MAG: hypothetical protein FJ034_05415, partial [Chloroflexi bacterium]|nr:hypothetical protein [Chloroflexota bacterium]